MSEVSDPSRDGVIATVFGGVHLLTTVPRSEAGSFSDCKDAVRTIVQRNVLPVFCDVCNAPGESQCPLLCNIFVVSRRKTPVRAFGMLYCGRPHCIALHQTIFAERVAKELRKEYPTTMLRSLDVCAHCGKTDDLFVDSRCGSVYYCSEACQRADWPNHRRFCFLRGRQCHAHECVCELPNAAN